MSFSCENQNEIEIEMLIEHQAARVLPHVASGKVNYFYNDLEIVISSN